MYKLPPQKCKKFAHVRPLHEICLNKGGSTLLNQYRPNGDPDPVIRLITKSILQ